MSFQVPHDEQRLRRTVRFLVRSQVVLSRVLGGVLVFLGLVRVVPDTSDVFGYAIIVGGLVLVAAIGPITVAWAMRTQAAAIRDESRMTLDDEWLQVSYPLVETRCRWAGLGRVVETPEVWYVMFGKAQAMTIPKDAMTSAQQAEFADFVARLRPAAT
jgi:hypothetical protein